MAGELETIPLSDGETVDAILTNVSTAPQKAGILIDHEYDEEKSRLIQQVFELQNTLDDLAQRVDAVKDENVKLKSENQILGQYIENLMAASSVFQGNNKVKPKVVEKQTKERRK